MNIIKIFTTLFLCLVLHTVQAQFTLNAHQTMDHISFINEPTVDWEAGISFGFAAKLRYEFKGIGVGVKAFGHTFDLIRPNITYEDQAHLLIAPFLSKSILNKKKNIEFRLDAYPYLRSFVDEFYSASLIMDRYNYGFGFDLLVSYIPSKNVTVGLGYSFMRDFHSATAGLEEVSDTRRFALLQMHSLVVNFGYYFQRGFY